MRLVLHFFHAIDISKRVYYQQAALVRRYSTTNTCFGYYLQPSLRSVSIYTQRHI